MYFTFIYDLQDTMVLANFNRVLMDEFWGDPEVFKPERFINETGNITIPNQYLPFSHGEKIKRKKEKEKLVNVN